MSGFLQTLLICAALAAGSFAQAGTSALIRNALADPTRPPEQVARDADRKPAEVVALAGLKPGARVADFMSGGGYFTRIFSRVVGSSGRVYAFLPNEELANCKPEEVAGTRAIEHNPAFANVSVLTGPANSFRAPEPLDLVFTSQNYHDLHDDFMRPTDAAVFNKAVFAALKPGGAFVVIDHAAQPGSGLRDTDTLHRIDPASIIREVQAAGFVLESQSDLLRNPADTHMSKVFDPQVRGHTDQVFLRFRKPLERITTATRSPPEPRPSGSKARSGS
jgi:predicted methyltransferase